MKKLPFPSLVAAALFAFAACSSETPTQGDSPGEPQTSQPASTSQPTLQPKVMGTPAVHDAKCGCSIDGIGHCGNYIRIDGKYVPLLHPTLGKMQFCQFKDKGAKIETIGAIKDGKFVAESWKLVE
ncbi:MAG TPA: hypothetical protein ENI87_12825 [bacterium]|nr:hypothetical protein [bacterium]